MVDIGVKYYIFEIVDYGVWVDGIMDIGCDFVID